MILLDTTILVYALGEEHPLRRPCRTLVDAVGAGDIAATTTVEVIQELIHVRARRRSRHDAAIAALAYAELLTPLVSPDEHDLRLGIDLFETVDALGAFDAVLAATAQRADTITGLASADRAFAAIRGLTHHDPADPDFLSDLGITAVD